jgi:hypothetical protein
MQPRSFRVEIRIALIEPVTSSTNSSRSLGQLLASARFARDQTPSCSLVGGRIVHNHDHLAPHVAQQLA